MQMRTVFGFLDSVLAHSVFFEDLREIPRHTQYKFPKTLDFPTKILYKYNKFKNPKSTK